MDDSVVFDLTAEQLLEGIKAASTASDVRAEVAYVLGRIGLVKDGTLTEPGRGLFRLAWVLRRQEDAEHALGQAVRQLTPVQVIEQELRGLGPVPEDGVVDLLRQHGAIPLDCEVNSLRPALRWLNKVGVLVYSNKLKTVRSLAPAPDAALAGEVQAIAAMISPKTPYRNVVKLRRVIRPMRGVVWWADPHFGARALEELAEELETSEVTEIRILSGDNAGVLSDKSGKDFKRFSDEMAQKGVSPAGVSTRRGTGMTVGWRTTRLRGMSRPSTPSTRTTTARSAQPRSALPCRSGGIEVPTGRSGGRSVSGPSGQPHRAPDHARLGLPTATLPRFPSG